MKMFFAIAVGCMLTLSSCLTVIHSLFTKETILQDRRIEGDWTGNNLKIIHAQTFMKSWYNNIFDEKKKEDKKMEDDDPSDSIFISKLYVISWSENGYTYNWFAGLVMINGQYFLQLQPDICFDSKGEEVKDLGMATSSIAKLEWINNNTVVLNFLNGERIKEIILDGKARIRYEYDPLFSTVVITASSTELQKFIEKYGKNESLFSGGEVIRLTRKM